MKGIDKKLDDAWTLLVKLKGLGKCEYCGAVTPLNSHHVYSRSKMSTRWEVENGVCLCVGHHVFSSVFSAHKTPTEFTEWIKDKRGDEWYNNLRLKAHQTIKLHKHEKQELLKSLTDQIKQLNQTLC